jgi:uncharacterized protein
MSYGRNRGLNINPIWVIIGVCVVIFLFSNFDQRNLIENRFALIPAFIGQQPWTLLTYMFLHGGVWHLLFNMLTLYFFGTFAIALVGETAFLTTYFVGGIVGGLTYLLFSFAPIPYFQNSQYIAVVGASGAIYALGGLLIVMRPNTRVVAFPIPIPMPLWVAILIGFVLVLLYPNVAWQAHLGGIIYGAAVGYYFRRRESGGRRY